MADSAVRFGPPSVLSLTPAPVLVARVVTFKNGEEPGPFLAAARARLAESGLPDGDSIRLQGVGLGGRTRMGCGFFLPVREEA